MSRPRVGFVGTGWIGRHRMEAMLATGALEAVAVADPAPQALESALALAPAARAVDDLDAALDAGVDGVVIATPSAAHAEQSIRALERGVAVFCQKPLGRTAAEVEAVVKAARIADRLLAVDLSYRFTAGMRAIRERIAAGELGRVFAADLTFHNAYGPDKPWFYDPAQSGGGAAMDLGVHLADLVLWALGWPKVIAGDRRLFARGEPLEDRTDVVEDFAVAALEFEGGTIARLTCSWNAHAGQDAEISAVFHGDRGGAAFRNVGGSFYDFTAEVSHGTSRQTLASPPDDWGGRAAADWARRLAAGERFDPETERLVESARIVDGIYGR